jgi:hypothetical protein
VCNSVDIMIMSLVLLFVMKENSVGAFDMVNGPVITELKMCTTVIMSLVRPFVMKENSVRAFVVANGPAISVSRRRTMTVNS